MLSPAAKRFAKTIPVRVGLVCTNTPVNAALLPLSRIDILASFCRSGCGCPRLVAGNPQNRYTGRPELNSADFASGAERVEFNLAFNLPGRV